MHLHKPDLCSHRTVPLPRVYRCHQPTRYMPTSPPRTDLTRPQLGTVVAHNSMARISANGVSLSVSGIPMICHKYQARECSWRVRKQQKKETPGDKVQDQAIAILRWTLNKCLASLQWTGPAGRDQMTFFTGSLYTLENAEVTLNTAVNSALTG